VLILFVITNISLKAQTYYFDKYDVRDGIAQSKVNTVVQDKSGFLWIGTGIGVSKFDGSTFQNYSSDHGLSENGVKSIFIDSKGILWFGHLGGGVSRYDGFTFQKIDLLQLKISQDITSIIEDDKGKLWFSTAGDGVFRIDNPQQSDSKKFIFQKYKGKETVSSMVFSIQKSKDNILYFVTDLGLKTYNSNKNSFDFYKNDQIPGYFQITCLYEDSHSNLWFGTYNGGLYKFDVKTNHTKRFDVMKDGLVSNWISTISGDRSGKIWVGSWGDGISVIENDLVVQKFNLKNGLHDNKILAIEEDREGNILIGTNESGLLIYKGKRFTSFSKSDGLINDQVWAITKDVNGHIWFGTNEGISVFNPQTKKTVSYTSENSNIASKQIRFLKSDKNGNVWIGTNDNGLQRYHVQKNMFIYDNLINNYFPSQNSLVSALEVDKNNNLWVGTTDGLIYYEVLQEKISTFSQGNGLEGNDISLIFCDSNNEIWVGSKRKGLVKIVFGKITKLNLKEHFTPNCMAEEKDGKLWIGTEDRGIIVIKHGKILKRLNTNDGLLSNNVLTLEVDENDNVFIGTSAGLNKYNQKENKFFVYTEKSGFSGIEVKNHASYKDNEGNIWFGTVNGAIKYSRKDDIPNLLEPITFISRFRVNFKDHPLEKNLVLNYLDRSITFDFGSICLSNTQGIKYMYRLIGADKDWISVIKNQTTVTYSPLPPGKYTFEVKASNNEGIWNAKPVQYSFSIDPPFWKTWWFYTLITVLLILILVSYIKIRERNLIAEKTKLEEKVIERTAEVVKEKEKSEVLLLNTLPIKVVNELKMYGKSEPESFDNVTVCFSDLCDFTNISSRLETTELINELNELFTSFDDILVKHNSERIKTIGDSYMAVCGLPEKDIDHALNMARSAIDMREYLIERSKTNDIKWKMRIGLHSGKVTGGIVGIKKYIYDIFGDTVNTASRMESNSEPMKINCSETTYNFLKDKFRFTEREAISVKGKGSMKMYFLEEEIRG